MICKLILLFLNHNGAHKSHIVACSSTESMFEHTFSRAWKRCQTFHQCFWHPRMLYPLWNQQNSSYTLSDCVTSSPKNRPQNETKTARFAANWWLLEFSQHFGVNQHLIQTSHSIKWSDIHKRLAFTCLTPYVICCHTYHCRGRTQDSVKLHITHFSGPIRINMPSYCYCIEWGFPSGSKYTAVHVLCYWNTRLHDNWLPARPSDKSSYMTDLHTSSSIK